MARWGLWGYASRPSTKTAVVGKDSSNTDVNTNGKESKNDNKLLSTASNSSTTTTTPTTNSAITVSPHLSGPALLNEPLASAVSKLSNATRISIRLAALIIEVLLELARFSAVASLGISKRALIAAVSSTRVFNCLRLLPLVGNSASNGDNQLATTTSSTSLALQYLIPSYIPFLGNLFDKYTSMGIYFIHHAFTLAELLTMTTFSYTSSTIKFSLKLADETVRVIDGFFGSTETSRALASFICLVKNELAEENYYQHAHLASGQQQQKKNPISAKLNSILWFSSTTKALMAYCCLQYVNRDRIREKLANVIVFEGVLESGVVVSLQKSPVTVALSTMDVNGGDEEVLLEIPAETELAAEQLGELLQSAAGGSENIEKWIGNADGSSADDALDEEDEEDGPIGVLETKGLLEALQSMSVQPEQQPIRAPSTTPSSRPSSSLSVLSVPSPSSTPSPANSPPRHSPYQRRFFSAPVSPIMGPSFAATLEDAVQLSDHQRSPSPIDTPTSASTTSSPSKQTFLSKLKKRTTIKSRFFSVGAQNYPRTVDDQTGELDRKYSTKSLPTSFSSQSSTASASQSSSRKTLLKHHRLSIVIPPRSTSSNYTVDVSLETTTTTTTTRTTTTTTTTRATMHSPIPKMETEPTQMESSLDPHSPLYPPHIFPQGSLIKNLYRYMKFSSGAYGHRFMRILGIRELEPHYHDNLLAFSVHTGLEARCIISSSYFQDTKTTTTTTTTSSGAANESASASASASSTQKSFVAYKHTVPVKTSPNTKKPAAIQSSSNSTSLVSLSSPSIKSVIHYLSVDHENHAIVLTLRGTLGLSDLLTDLTCNFAEFWDTIGVVEGDGGGNVKTDLGNGNTGNTHHQDSGLDLSSTPVSEEAPSLQPQPQPQPQPQFLGHVHAGMLHSAMLLSTTVLSQLSNALNDYPDYGLVLCGHSLGGGVASLLGLMWSEQRETTNGRDGEWVIRKNVGLPAGRDVHVYVYGPPGVMSLDLAQRCSKLITAVVHNNDAVPSLSLGLLRDFKNVVINFIGEEGMAEKVISKILGVYPFRDNAKEKESSSSSASSSPDISADDRDWYWSLFKTLRADMCAEKLFPPGTVYRIHANSVPSSSSSSSSSSPSTQVKLERITNVEETFGTVFFAKSMLSDHAPSGYEFCVDKLFEAASKQGLV